MDIRALNAAAAYAARLARSGGGAPPGAAGGTSGGQPGAFAGMVKSAIEDTASALKKSEALSTQALVNPADLGQVVAAVASAEVTLQTVVAVRDRVVQAYQDILRMPI
jgi:flagellar hook-basal body complex protein FliE